MNSADKKQILKKVRRIKSLFESEKIPRLEVHEVYPKLPKSSRENYLYFTLPPAINFQRNSPNMWQSALDTWNDKKTNYLFFPERIVRKSRDVIKKDLAKHNLALQRNKHTDIWIAICRTLHEEYADDPRVLLRSRDHDTPRILSLLQERKKDFPYLSGPKLSNYWLYILSLFTNVKFKNMAELSVVPDTHITNCTVKLGLSVKKLSPEKTALLWEELLEGSGISPAEMHSPLWHWSRNGFKPEVR